MRGFCALNAFSRQHLHFIPKGALKLAISWCLVSFVRNKDSALGEDTYVQKIVNNAVEIQFHIILTYVPHCVTTVHRKVDFCRLLFN